MVLSYVELKKTKGLSVRRLKNERLNHKHMHDFLAGKKNCIPFSLSAVNAFTHQHPIKIHDHKCIINTYTRIYICIYEAG